MYIYFYIYCTCIINIYYKYIINILYILYIQIYQMSCKIPNGITKYKIIKYQIPLRSTFYSYV